jgi:hypothetical protein
MKKILFVGSITLMGLLVTTLWVSQQGCTSTIPPLSNIILTSTPTLGPNIVSNFNDDTLNMNTGLANSMNGFFYNGTYGDTTTSMAVTAPVPAEGAGDNFALHIWGTYTDPGNASYPAFQLQGFPRSDKSYYNASSFTGIKFSWNCPSDDNSVQRFLCLVDGRIAPPSQGGSCTGAAGAVPCYDYSSITLPNTAGAWQQISSAFTAFNLQYSSGSPTNVTPTDLTQIINFMWTNRSNNVAGTYTADYWIDNVQLY